MQKNIVILLVFLLTIVVYSCNQKEIIVPTESPEIVNTEQTPSKPIKPTENCTGCKARGLSIDDWNSLSDQDKKQAWLDKLSYILNDENINDPQLTLIGELMDEIGASEVYAMTSNIKEIALDLVSEFSETDFVATFTTLEYNSLSGTNTPTCSWCSADINSTTSAPGWTGTPPTCNCRWTCGDPLASSSCTLYENPNCCIPTSSGCGFLWLFSCIGHDQL